MHPLILALMWSVGAILWLINARMADKKGQKVWWGICFALMCIYATTAGYWVGEWITS